MTLKKIAINSAIVIGTIVLAFLMWEFREAVIIFVLSLAIAAAARPYVDSLSARGVSSGLAIVLIYVLFIVFLGLIFWAVGNQLMNEVGRLSNNIALTYDQIWTSWPKGTQFQQLIVHQLPPPNVLYSSFSPERINSITQGVLGITASLVNLSAIFVTILMLSIYWSVDRVHFERLWLSILSVDSRARARDIWRAIERDFGAYVQSELLQSILAGLFLGIGLWAIGVKYPTLLAVFGALAWLVPWLGGVIALIPITLTALSQGLGVGIIASVYAIAVLVLLEFLIQPRFFRSRQFSSLLTILLIIALIEPFGLFGLIIAPPLAAAIELVFRYNLMNRSVPEVILSAEQLILLRERLVRIRDSVKHSPDTLEPQTLNILERLESLVERSENALEPKKPQPQAAADKAQI